MEDEDMARGDVVIVYLVKKSAVDVAFRETKRSKQGDGVSVGTSMGEIYADSRKLRQCSKYFEILMSERWTLDTKTGSSSRLEFYLELQTETLYYKDCFFRMNFSFPKQIPSVRHCIELLKVATQIQYQELVDVGMQYLAAVPWTADEEKLIRVFFNSGLFVADIASDLNARLDLS